MKHIYQLTYKYNTDLYLLAMKALDSIKPSTSAYKETVLLDSYHSATIEGARTTLAEVKESFVNPKTKSDKMVVNNFKLLDKLYSNVNITDENIRRLWEQLVDGCCENISAIGIKYRSKMVTVCSNTETIHVPVEPQDIQWMMNELFDYIYHSKEEMLIKIAVVHFYFVYVHPFCDGNGRMARIITNWMLSWGRPNLKFISISSTIHKHVSQYYKAIELGEKNDGDISAFVEYMLKVIIYTCEQHKLLSNELTDNERKVLTKLKTDTTVKKAAIMLKCCEQTARKVLNGLVEKNILTKRRDAQTLIYTRRVKF